MDTLAINAQAINAQALGTTCRAPTDHSHLSPRPSSRPTHAADIVHHIHPHPAPSQVPPSAFTTRALNRYLLHLKRERFPRRFPRVRVIRPQLSPYTRARHTPPPPPHRRPTAATPPPPPPLTATTHRHSASVLNGALPTRTRPLVADRRPHRWRTTVIHFHRGVPGVPGVFEGGRRDRACGAHVLGGEPISQRPDQHRPQRRP